MWITTAVVINCMFREKSKERKIIHLFLFVHPWSSVRSWKRLSNVLSVAECADFRLHVYINRYTSIANTTCQQKAVRECDRVNSRKYGHVNRNLQFQWKNLASGMLSSMKCKARKRHRIEYGRRRNCAFGLFSLQSAIVGYLHRINWCHAIEIFFMF